MGSFSLLWNLLIPSPLCIRSHNPANHVPIEFMKAVAKQRADHKFCSPKNTSEPEGIFLPENMGMQTGTNNEYKWEERALHQKQFCASFPFLSVPG